VTRGFLLGKFMPPHAGHMRLCETALRLCDRLTVLVCWLPDDPIPGPLRLDWMRELLPTATVVGHGAVVPQSPGDHPDFWPIWRGIVRAAHPEPVERVFAGEDYGARLAAELGAEFVHVGPRQPDEPSASEVRAGPWRCWARLPAPVRGFYARTIAIHGAESTGKTMLAGRLAAHFGTIWVPEYGRVHCAHHGPDVGPSDLVAIAERQSAAIAAGRRWCDRRFFADTDALTTAAWAEMLIGEVPDGVSEHERADLYLLLEDDVPWRDDGTRYFADPARRRAFAHICRRVLDDAGVRFVAIRGDWDERFAGAVAAIERLAAPTP
jgi:HTH-type transcriptional repressor of NAD biosynthesis genes